MSAKDVVEELLRGLKSARADKEKRACFDAFAVDLGRMHEDVCRCNLNSLNGLLDEAEFYMPITQRTFSREVWDMRPNSWDDPRFENAVGLDRVRGRRDSRKYGAPPVPVARMTHEWLAAMDEELSHLRHLPLRVAGTRLPDVLKTASFGYSQLCDFGKSDKGVRTGSAQIVLSYLNLLECLLRISIRCGTGCCGLPQLGFDAASRYDELFWLVMPELPLRSNAFGGFDYAVACMLEFSKRMNTLEMAPSDLFACWMGQAACCLADCLDAAEKRFCFVPDELFETLRTVMEKVRDGLERDEPQMYLPRRTIFPEILGCCRGWQSEIVEMRQASYRSRRIRQKNNVLAIAHDFKACVSAFVAAVQDEDVDMGTLVPTCVSALTDLVRIANLSAHEA